MGIRCSCFEWFGRTQKVNFLATTTRQAKRKAHKNSKEIERYSSDRSRLKTKVMHGTPLLSAKGNHDQDYNSGGSDYDEQHHQAHQYNNAPPPQAPPQQPEQQQQQHQQGPPPPSQPSGNGKQTTGYNGNQQHHRL